MQRSLETRLENDVRTMLSQQNANTPKGQFSDHQTTEDILANDQLLKAEDYKPLTVSYTNGAAVRLSDIANVQDGVENIRAAGFLNGRKLQDDVIDIELALVTNGRITTDFVGPHTDYLSTFPYLGRPHI